MKYGMEKLMIKGDIDKEAVKKRINSFKMEVQMRKGQKACAVARRAIKQHLKNCSVAKLNFLSGKDCLLPILHKKMMSIIEKGNLNRKSLAVRLAGKANIQLLSDARRYVWEPMDR